MGLCENSTLIDEPSCESIAEKRSCVEFTEKPVSEHWVCSEAGSGMIGANVNDTSVLDGYLGMTSEDTTCFGGHDDVKETGIVKRDVLVSECGNVGGAGLEGLEDDECGVSGVDLNENRSENGVGNSPSSFLVLSQDESNLCISSDDVTGMVIGNRDELVSVCENMVGSVFEEMMNNETVVCLNETRREVDACCVETDGLFLEKRVFQGDEYVKSVEGCETPLGETPGYTSPRSHDQLDQKKDDKEVNVPSLEGTVEVMKDRKDVLTEVKVVTGDETFLSESCGMTLESMPVTDVPRNCLQEHEHKDDKIVGCLPLAGVEKDTYDEILTSSTTEATPTTGSVRNCVQQDDQKDDKSTVCPSLEGFMEVMEEKTDTLGGIDKNRCDQMLPSQSCEKPAELIPLPGALRNFVDQDDLKNDKGIGSPFSEGIGEFVEEKDNDCDQMFLPQTSAMPSELKSGTCSPRDCIEQNQLKGNVGTAKVMKEKDYALAGIEKDICEQVLSLQDCAIHSESAYVTSSTEEFVEEKRDFLDGIQTDSCHPRSPSEYNELHTDVVLSTGLSSISTQKNKQETESISDTGVEWKTDTSASMEANMRSWILSSDPGKIPSEPLCKDDLMSGGGHNDEKDHDSFSHQDEEAIKNVIETKSNDDACMLTLPVQSCQSSLENLLLTDLLCNHIQQNEQRTDRSVDSPSAESVNEVLEEKSDVSTDVRVEISTQVLPVEESLKDDSSRMAFNDDVEKLVSLQSCQPSGVDENCSCTKLDVTYIFQKDPLAATSSSRVVDGSGQIDHEEKDNVRVDCLSETKHSDFVSSSARRSGRRISRSSQKDQTKRVSRNCRRRAKVQNPHGSIDIFKFVRRKRSCFSKPARSSIWGLLGNIAQILNKSDVTEFSQVQNQGSQKPRGGRRSRKQNKIQAGKSSLGSNGKCHASTKCIRLKVKVGKEVCQRSLHVAVPEMVGNTVSDDAIIGDQRTSESPKFTHGVEDKSGAEETGQFQCFNENPEETEKHLDDSILDDDLANKEDGILILNKSNGDVADDYRGIPADKGDEVLGGEIENNYVDPGTSPDSEVIDVVPDAQVGPGSQEGLNKTVLTSSTYFASPKHVTSSKRGKKKDNLLLEGNCTLEGSSHVAERINKTKPPKKRGGRQKTGDGSSETLSALPGTNTSNSLSSEEFCMEPLPSAEAIELGGEGMASAFKSRQCSVSKSSKSAGMRKGRSKASGSERSRRKNACTPGVNQRKSANKRKVKEKGVSIKKGKEKGVCDQVEDKTECHPEIGNHVANDGERIESDNTSASDVAKMGIASSGVPEQCSPPDSAWVRCDECYKWRRIQVALAAAIDENCRWVCKDNMDKAFADCSTPQEKTNADINAELGLSDCEEVDGISNYNRSEKEFHYENKSAFRRIDSNVFLHRSRKTQTIDEIMVCHCKQPRDGRLGCGDECLNRMLNIECVQGTCPCGDLCSNQQFQKRKYVKMEWQRFGKKGFGLKLLENILKGQFIIEYVGEVLDMQAYEARQKEYAANGHKHFYFMTLNGSEVIDACAKGNLGRFINHSCDPNCRTEKWMVHGEICIGLFALRDIKEGEELTFDYNYVRVFGAAAKKCHCGSPLCRGYIGGDLQNTEVIYQGDSDEEYPEPLMIEDAESGDDLEISTYRTSTFCGDSTRYALEDRDKMDDATRAVGRLDITTEIEDFRNHSVSAISQVHRSLELEDSKGSYPSTRLDLSMQAEDVSSRSLSAAGQDASLEEETKNNTLSLIPQVETSSPTIISSKLLLGGDDASRKAKSDKVEQKQGLPKSHPRIKTSHSSGSLKKGKLGSSPLNGNKVKTVANKSQLFSFKPKKSVEGSSNGRFEAVQEKLNELLDADGGISKRKDAPKGYLKLLLLTAASGDSGNGEAIQSNRDLSMILDALLKTKSRVVLLDIINKNGLQMLHNMMKQYRRDFKKTPILRKLLKVLEYLAVREILTRDHITGGPPCAGMESFRESILSLTEHDDKQVHQIARNFRDKWIPKSVRKSSYMDRDDVRMDFHRGVNCNRLSTSQSNWHDQGLRPSEAIDCVMQSLLTTSVDSTANESGLAPCTGGCQNNGSITRKRKTRWDQPAKVNLDSKSVLKEQKLESVSLQQYESIPLPKRSQVVVDHTDKLSREESSCPNCVHNHYSREEAFSSEDGGHITQQDVPPGFSSHLSPPVVSPDASSTTDLPQQNVPHLKCLCDVAIGHPQGKFISRLPVSYGIPLHILQQFGSPQAETVDSWVIAPGMPFHPFPPLPPFPRDRKDTPPVCTVSCKTANESAEEWQQDSHQVPACDPEEDSPSTTGANQSDADTQGTDTQQPFKRMRGSSNDLARRYFRQQKRKGPPWLWRRSELRGSYCSQDALMYSQFFRPVGFIFHKNSIQFQNSRPRIQVINFPAEGKRCSNDPI